MLWLICAHSIFGGVWTWNTIAYKAEHANIVILEIEQIKLCKHVNVSALKMENIHLTTTHLSNLKDFQIN